MVGIIGDFDTAILDDSGFKEDAVREEIVSPILKALGYRAGGRNAIVRSTSLEHPFVMIGSKKVSVNIFPDYLLTAEGRPAWILDAKSPNQNIHTGVNCEQAFSYAIHPDVRTKFYALCNGRSLTVFNVSETNPVLDIEISKIDERWEEAFSILSPSNFLQAPNPNLIKKTRRKVKNYSEITPPLEIHQLKKQSAKRHFGAHPYFTKQVWNVVREYIENFTEPGDVVLDPFGGSGVTNIEALNIRSKILLC